MSYSGSYLSAPKDLESTSAAQPGADVASSGSPDQTQALRQSSQGHRGLPSLVPRWIREGLTSPADGPTLKLPEGLVRPKVEQDMVGFGIREILGLAPKKRIGDSSETEKVFFATNRSCEGQDAHGLAFGKNVDSVTRYGTAEVQCPNGKPRVDRESQSAQQMSLEEFKETLRKQIAANENRAVLVYVHGCFTDFGRGMGYGAYILRGLNFKGPMVVYSWPTVGRPSVSEGVLNAIELYRKDEETCIQSAHHLKDLLQVLSKELGAESVHVVSYSMGARTLLEAIRQLGPEDDFPGRGITSHLYFMAPDVAAHKFSEIMREFKFPWLRQRQAGEQDTGSISAADSSMQSDAASGQNEKTGDRASSRRVETEGSSRAVPADSAAVLHNMVERMADAWGFVGDSVAGLRQLGQAWREARMTGWQELRDAVFPSAPDAEEVKPAAELAEPVAEPLGDTSAADRSSQQGGMRTPFRNAHVHLYAAQNDIALLLSELIDSGVPKIRAGRRTKDFVLCQDAFNTVDVTSLKTGLLTTGHFYLFHEIVREEMEHVLSGRTGDAWWRQGMQWENGRGYIRLRSIHPVKHALVEAALQDLKATSEYMLAPKVDTLPVFWNSA